MWQQTIQSAIWLVLFNADHQTLPSFALDLLGGSSKILDEAAFDTFEMVQALSYRGSTIRSSLRPHLLGGITSRNNQHRSIARHNGEVITPRMAVNNADTRGADIPEYSPSVSRYHGFHHPR